MAKKNKAEMAFETYRYIASTCKNATATHVMRVKTKTLSPTPAVTIEEVEGCIIKWKASMAYLDNVGKLVTMSDDDKKTVLNSMLAESLQLFMTTHHHDKTSYGEFEQ